MKKKKIKLSELRVKSFVTSVPFEKRLTILGGSPLTNMTNVNSDCADLPEEPTEAQH